MKFTKWLTIGFLAFSCYIIFYIFNIDSSNSNSNNENQYNYPKTKSEKKQPVLEKSDTSVVSTPVPEPVQEPIIKQESTEAINPVYLTCMANINNCISCSSGGIDKDCRSVEFENNYQKIESLRSWGIFSEYLDKISSNQNATYLNTLTNPQLRDILVNFSIQSRLDYDELLLDLGIDKSIPPDVVECKVPDEKFCFKKEGFND